MATCDALWVACLSVMCRRSIDTWAWAAFCVLVYCWVFTSFPLVLHLRSLLPLSPLFHILLSVVTHPVVSCHSLWAENVSSAFIQLRSLYSSCLSVSLTTNFCLFSFSILLTVFSQPWGWHTFTNDSRLFNTDSACSDSSKSKVRSTYFVLAFKKSLISLSLLFLYS